MQVHVIGDQDEQPGSVVGIDPSCRVRHDERADAESPEHADTERDAVGSDPLVEVRAPAHDRDRNAAEHPEHESARVADGSRHGPAGDLGVRDLHARVELIRERAEPAAENESDAWLELRLVPDPADGCIDRSRRALGDAGVVARDDELLRVRRLVAASAFRRSPPAR